MSQTRGSECAFTFFRIVKSLDQKCLYRVSTRLRQWGWIVGYVETEFHARGNGRGIEVSAARAECRDDHQALIDR